MPSLATLCAYLLLAGGYLSLAASAKASSSHSDTFENSAVVRTIELGGATTQVTTQYQVRSLKDGTDAYYFALAEEEVSNTSWMEVKLKGSLEPLNVAPPTHRAQDVALYRVALPKHLKHNDTATIIVNTIQSHVSRPLPASVRQTEALGLFYETGLYVLSPYATVIQRIKFRSNNPTIIEYTDNSRLKKYADATAHPVTKSGTTITYGPFRSLPASSSHAFVQDHQEKVSVHYKYDAPVMTVAKLERAAEISHWGSNLNIQDNIWIKNDGAKLKGHFSRLEHLKQNVQRETAQMHIIRNVIFNLPSGVRDPYYYDVIGNVSTSNFRPAIKRGNSPLERSSILDIRPRYPILGGWNYTFTLGYDMPLEDWAGYDKSKGHYVVAVPFLTALPGSAYDVVEVKIILPEAAVLTDVQLPFDIELSQTTHITYLDTYGRPALILKGENLTDRHNGLVYVVYTLDAKAHLQKPLTVAGALFSLFLLAMSLRRFDWNIRTKKTT